MRIKAGVGRVYEEAVDFALDNKLAYINNLHFDTGRSRAALSMKRDQQREVECS